MNLRRAIGSAALGLGAAAVATRALESAAGTLEPPLSGERSTYRWRGIDVSVVEAGDPADPTLVCLHGINAAGSAGEFRAVFDALAEEYHVVAPDLPGFGCSDRPPLRYSAALYEDFVADFLAEYDAPAVLASSLTAAYVAAAVRGPTAAHADGTPVSALALVCPTARAGPEPPKTAVRELLRTPVVGEALFALLASKPSIRYFLTDHGFADPRKITDEWVAYDHAITHLPGARFAPASFVSGFLDLDVDLGAVLADLDVPITVAWGREAELPPLDAGRELAERVDARLVVFDDADLLPHAEFPEQFADMLTEGVESVAEV
jgi:pimeloyl-ACP methyl ester carboxylesterase